MWPVLAYSTYVGQYFLACTVPCITSSGRLHIFLVSTYWISSMRFSVMVERTVSARPPENAVVEPKARQRKPLAPSVLSRPQKVATIILVCAMTFVGPASAGIYYPSLGLLARDLHVSYSEISLTITAFMVSFYIILVSGCENCETHDSPSDLRGLVSVVDRGIF